MFFGAGIDRVVCAGFGYAPFRLLIEYWIMAATAKRLVPELSEQVAGVKPALTLRFVGALRELPVVEAGAEAARNGSMVFGAVVVTEAVVGETERFGEQPAFTFVLSEEGFDALLAVSADSFDLSFKIMEGDK